MCVLDQTKPDYTGARGAKVGDESKPPKGLKLILPAMTRHSCLPYHCAAPVADRCCVA